MANVHVQTAATNLRQAVNDVRLKQKQLGDEISRIKRETDDRLREIRNEQAMLIAQSGSTDDAATKITNGARIDKLDAERQQVEQASQAQILELEKQVKDFEDQAFEIDGIARQLDRFV